LKTFALDALNGLNEIHKNNIIHCDIKPHNFLIFKTEEEGEEELNESYDSFDPTQLLKITDFGLSHVIPLGSDKALMKQRCGTFSYTAPEIGNVSHDYSPLRMYILIDLWIFGLLGYVCIKWQLLICQLPLNNINMVVDRYRLEMQIGGIMNLTS
jgi:serine/threonine protein kinase